MAASIEDYRWLVGPQAEPWLAAAREEMERAGGASVAVVARLRVDLTAERVHLVCEQVELRGRAREKFSLAERMFFTRKGLEQATDERLAEYKANRFGVGAPAVDLCCGIGGDLMSLAARGPAMGVDSDEAAALLAAANLRACGMSDGEDSVFVQDAVEFPLDGKMWHCDPDRRATGRRATCGELFEPSLESLEGLLASNGDAAIKLAPATEAPPDWNDSAELEWLGSRGECRQQVAWLGQLARHPGLRAATVVDAEGRARTICGEFVAMPPSAERLGRFLYEPDAAVLAAKLEGALCLEHSLSPVSAGIAYLTGDQRIDDAALDGFEICDVLPLDRKRVQAYYRDHKIGRLEIKKRGVEVEPERLRKEIAAEGDESATILIAPVGGKVRAVVARRI